MITTGKVNIGGELFSLWRPLALVLAVAVAVVFASDRLGKYWISIEVTPLTALGVALGVFLSLRNNIVWDRYWEARTLWGRLVNYSRTLTRQVISLSAGGSAEEQETFRRDMVLLHLAFVKSFRAYMRDEPPGIHLADYLTPDELLRLANARTIPAALLLRSGERLREAYRRGLVNDFHMLRLDETLTEFANILGGCERIKNTPLPPAYTYLAHKSVLVYCCLLPFGLVADIGWVTPLLTALISFAFLTLDRISDLIEQPFSTMVNDLPLNAMTRNIEIELLEALGETDLPPPLQPDSAGVLL